MPANGRWDLIRRLKFNQMMSKFFLIFCRGVILASHISDSFDLAHIIASIFPREVPGQAMWDL